MPTVLITGASRGIGRQLVAHLAAAGWDVVAGVRTAADAEAVAAIDRVSTVLLDVTDEAHIAALAGALPARLDAVVNNAGIVVAGPVEAIDPAAWREQFEVNVFGQLAVTQAVLPKLRASRGRVVFVSSVNGRLSVPMLGAYSASKFALEGAADALRVELRPWGVAVAVVEPAQTDTDMWRLADTMVTDTEAGMSAEFAALYAGHIAGMKKFVPAARRMTVPAAKVAAVVERALTARRPKARYIVGVGPRLQVTFMSNVPVPVRDRIIGLIAGVPRRRRR
ncbi:SDR family NAD(P)-dependent oxidoreductase [Mycobacterium sp. CPCC 205372]|uniref:SDR family NAD(P)-dependent oxidoreductase n=1 Tax=Mycobacterium hippophais TaxID=3016340 RepID=A0ABT4Q1F1_9MYCO|nr:SDR family NAD(P)-dependent oxidoreductase [Mycobacterium hippophais]MCZ8382602.1 SDR family NAD(P)-dependent oxidoreductase [Mycobacterium hippophais]